jgi:RNA polymerase sigma-70 factor (ECF subfamily)
MQQFSQNSMALFNDRDDKTVVSWCKSYYPIIEEKVNSITGGSPDDPDLVGEIIFRFLNRQVSFETIKSLNKYLDDVITGVCADEKRRKKTRRSNESRLEEHILNQHEKNIENQKKRLICEYLIRVAVEMLPAKIRQVFLLSHVYEMSNREIAAKLNLSIRTVEYHRSEAYKRLRLEIDLRQIDPREMLLPVILLPLLIAYLFIEKLLS